MAIEATQKLGFLNGLETQEILDPHCQALFAVATPFRKDAPFDFQKQGMTKVVYSEMPKMMRQRLQTPPHEVYSLHRKLSGAYLICIQLGAKVNCRKLLDEVLQRARSIDTDEKVDLIRTYLGDDYVQGVLERDQEIRERVERFN